MCPTLAPVSVGFSRQEYWRGMPFPSPGDLPDLGIESRSPALQEDSLPTYLVSLGVQMVKNLPVMRRPGFDPWVGKIPWRRKRLPALQDPLEKEKTILA